MNENREDQEAEIQNMIDELGKLLKGKGKKPIIEDYKIAQRTLDSKYKEIKDELGVYENTYCAGSTTKEGKAAKKMFEKFKKLLQELKAEKTAFLEELLKKEAPTQSEGEVFLAPQPDQKKGQRQKVIKAGDNMQAEAIEIVTGLERETDNQNQRVADMREQLLRQRDELLQIHQDTMSMQTTLKRSKDYLVEFTRDLYQDKFIRILVIMILLALIAVVIVGIVRRKSSSTSTTTTGTTTANSTTTSNTSMLTFEPVSLALINTANQRRLFGMAG